MSSLKAPAKPPIATHWHVPSGDGNDSESGGSGRDHLNGEAGDDSLNGQGGTDTIAVETVTPGNDRVLGDLRYKVEEIMLKPGAGVIEYRVARR